MAYSVIMPAFNAEATIEEAVASAFSQVPAPAEVIVGDDGSTDQTRALAAAAGARVLELSKANGAAARNRAVESSTQELQLFLDADDVWLPGHAQSHLEAHRRGESLVLSRAKPFFDSGEEPDWIAGRLAEGKHQWQDLINHRAWPTGSGFSVLRAPYLEIGGFNEKLIKFQDVDFWVRFAAQHGFYQIDEVLTRYRLREGSVGKGTTRHEENLETMLAGWLFASEGEKQRMRRVAHLLLSEQLPWPESLYWMKRAGFPIGNRFFWKCLIVSLKRTIMNSK